MSTRRAFGRGYTEETAAGTQGNAEEGEAGTEHSESDPIHGVHLTLFPPSGLRLPLP